MEVIDRSLSDTAGPPDVVRHAAVGAAILARGALYEEGGFHYGTVMGRNKNLALWSEGEGPKAQIESAKEQIRKRVTPARLEPRRGPLGDARLAPRAPKGPSAMPEQCDF